MVKDEETWFHSYFESVFTLVTGNREVTEKTHQSHVLL